MSGRVELKQLNYICDLATRMGDMGLLVSRASKALQANPRSKTAAEEAINATGRYYRAAVELLGALKLYNSAYRDRLIDKQRMVGEIVENSHRSIFA